MSTLEDARPADSAAAPTVVGAAGGSATDLSPAVRRLVRQFDLDVTGINGSGPHGRIRVSDVMGLLGGRTDTGKRDAERRPQPTDDDLAADDAPDLSFSAPSSASLAAAVTTPTTTVFECDLSRVLAHRKRQRNENVDLLLTSYFVAAVAPALGALPELAATGSLRLGVALTTADGDLRTALLDLATSVADAGLEQTVHTVDAALRTNLDMPLDEADLIVHHYGESGSLLTTPTPLRPGHAASIGIGRVRREVVVRNVDGTETPRVATRCYVGLSFDAARIDMTRANQVLGRAVRALEQWSE